LLTAFESRGALFFGDLVNATGLLRTEVERVWPSCCLGLVSSDSFAGLRALLVPSDRRRPLGGGYRRRGRIAPFGVETAGRWARTHAKPPIADEQVRGDCLAAAAPYGVVFRRLVQARNAARAVARDPARLPAARGTGEIRGGRFVGGFSGEQYALPEAIGLLRSTRREQEERELVAVSGADPLNLSVSSRRATRSPRSPPTASSTATVCRSCERRRREGRAVPGGRSGRRRDILRGALAAAAARTAGPHLPRKE